MVAVNMDVDIYAGTEIGLFKAVNVSKGIVVNYGELAESSKSKEISEIYWKDKENLIIGRRNGTIQNVHNRSSGDISIEDCKLIKKDIAIRGIHVAGDKLVTCTEDGTLHMTFSDDEVMEKSVGSHVSKMKGNPADSSIICTGGRENDLKLWNLENIDEPIFRAKNVRNDSLNLRVPVWITDTEFLTAPKSSTKVIVGTGYSKLKIYDTQAQRRPVATYDFSEHPITAIAVNNDSSCVIVGNSAGYMGSLDLRTGKEIGRFKGIAGSIRAISIHHRQPYVVECGIDRFLRIYDVKSRQLLTKMYLKTQLTSMALTDKDIMFKEGNAGESEVQAHEAKRKGEGSFSEEEEDDDVWNEMDIVQEKIKRKTKRKKKNE